MWRTRWRPPLSTPQLVILVRLQRGRTRLNGTSTAAPARVHAGSSRRATRRLVALGLLNEIAEFAASSGLVSKRLFLENAMRELPTTLCRGITRQVFATVPLRARLNTHPVFAELPVPTDDLIPVAGGPS